MPFETHPTDNVARLTAVSATVNDLTLEFEDTILSHQSLAERYGRLQVLASRSIAYAERLEHELSQPKDRADMRSLASVQPPVRKRPAATADAQELQARADVRPHGNVISLRQKTVPPDGVA